MMEVTYDIMKAWGWSEEDITWYLEDRQRLQRMTDRVRGWYEGLLAGFFYANGEQEEGVSHHRLPMQDALPGRDDFEPLDFRDLLAVLSDLDDDGGIFLPGMLVVKEPWGPEPRFFLHCTEAMHSLDEEALKEKWSMVAWGYRESLDRYKEEAA